MISRIYDELTFFFWDRAVVFSSIIGFAVVFVSIYRYMHPWKKRLHKLTFNELVLPLPLNGS